MHIGIIGTGYVGLVTGACFSEFGVSVTCVDRDERKIRNLGKGKIPFYEPGLEELVRKSSKQGRLRFSTRIRDAIESSLIVFIAVGTPPRGDGSADLEYVKDVSGEIADCIDSYKVIVTKSTVPVGTGKKIKGWMKERIKKEMDFDVASNPEFLREGSAIEDFMRPDRVVIGAESPQAIAILKDLYTPLYLIEAPFVITDIETAELVPGYAGIRPKIAGPGEEGDFFIQDKSVHGIAGYVGLYGIESPGLTTCLAIAAHVVKLLD